jgi:hypothetical protein
VAYNRNPNGFGPAFSMQESARMTLSVEVTLLQQSSFHQRKAYGIRHY